jgi:hypothetical protein
MPHSAEVTDIWLDWQADIYADPRENIAVSGGLGCGKTNLIPKICAEEARRFPGSRGAIAMPNYEQLFDSLHMEMLLYFAKMKLRVKYVDKFKRWEFSNGSTVEYVSFHVSMEDLKGPEYDYGIIDEADNREISRDKYEAFEGRVGRSERTNGSGKLWVFLNPVSHGHYIYQYYRELDDPNYVLYEISTYQNRRFLTEAYIRKRDARHPPGTPGHDRWTLGRCGIPSERAVFKHFKYERDRITIDEIKEQGGLSHFRSALMLLDGQETGWLQVGFTKSGVMVPIREKKFPGEAPDVIASTVSAMRDPLKLLKKRNRDGVELYDGIFDPAVRLNMVREKSAPLADRSHKAFSMVAQGGLPLAPARADISLGVNRGRNCIQRQQLKLLKLNDGRCATPEFLTELEEHQYSESGELEKEKWSLVRPFQFLAVATYHGVEVERKAGRSLRENLLGESSTPDILAQRGRAF